MFFLRSVNRVINIFRLTLSQFGHISAWWPLLAYAALRALVLWIGSNYTEPTLYPTLSAYLNWFGGLTAKLGIAPNASETFSHYPALFYLLPSQFEWLVLPYGVLFEGLAVGLTAWLLSRRLAPVHLHSDTSKRPGLTSWLRLALVWSVLYIYISAISYISADMLAEWLSGSPRRALAFDSGMFFLTHVALAPFALMIPLLGINRSGHNSLRSVLAGSLRVFVRHPLMVVFIFVLPPTVFILPLILANSPGAGLIYKLRPEFSLYILYSLTLANLLVNFFYAGTFTRLALEEARPR